MTNEIARHPNGCGLALTPPSVAKVVYLKRMSLLSKAGRAVVVVYEFAMRCTLWLGHKPRSLPRAKKEKKEEEVEKETPPIVVVELDDQGQFWRREQFVDAMTVVRAEREKDPRTYVVAFVHGWNHDARRADSNLRSFRRQLDQLKEIWDVPVVGVYVGWRGRTLPPVVNFWARQRTARRVGRGVLCEVLVAFEQLAYAGGDGRYVVVGHSFGALAVFEAVSGYLRTQRHEKLYEASTGVVREYGWSSLGPSILGFGDLVMLVNPAIDGLAYSDFGRAGLTLREDHPVRLVTVSAKNDSATGFWFPIGQFFGTLMQARQSRDSRSLLAAAGSLDRFVTHHLRLRNGKQASGEEAWSDAPENNWKATETEPLGGGWRRFVNEHTQWLLEPVSREDDALPFWMVTASPAILNGHNGVFGKEFMRFIVEFFAAIDLDYLELVNLAELRNPIAVVQEFASGNIERSDAATKLESLYTHAGDQAAPPDSRCARLLNVFRTQRED